MKNPKYRQRTDEERFADATERCLRNRFKPPQPFRTAIHEDEYSRSIRGGAIEMPPPLAREFADWALAMLGCDPIGHEDREVYVTPLPGHYGLGGYAVTINGSPVRAMMLVDLSFGGKIVLSNATKTKTAYYNIDHDRHIALLDGLGFLRRMGLPMEAYSNIGEIGVA